MASGSVGTGPLTDSEHSRHLRRAALASTVGTAIEWYDFLLYGQVAALVFGKLFFPHSAPLVATLQALATYFVGFLARPVGAAIFGHFGDRVGRKATLIATLLITGIATFAVGLVPTYASIGIWGAVILTILRLIQGIGVGGEWGGSVLLAMEWSKTSKNRGLITSFPQLGGPGGLLLANIAVLVFSGSMSSAAFLAWGWRIPFFLSAVMVAIGLWIRLGILETPAFRQIVDENRVERVPVLEVIRRQPKEIVLTALVRMAEQAPAYVYFVFVFTYGINVLHFSRNFLLSAVVVAAAVDLMMISLFGHLSDRIGRRRMYFIGALVTAVYGLIYFPLLNTMIPMVVFLAIVFSMVPHSMVYGPQAALIAERFTPRLRYSGCSLGYQLASIIAGGPAPFIATALFAAFGSSFPIALYILGCAIVGVTATALLTDYTNKDISEEYDRFQAASVLQDTAD